MRKPIESGDCIQVASRFLNAKLPGWVWGFGFSEVSEALATSFAAPALNRATFGVG